LFRIKPQECGSTNGLANLSERSSMDSATSQDESCGTATHVLLTLPVVLSALWALFCLFYHTRLLALLLSWLTNRFLSDSHVTIGALLTFSNHYIVYVPVTYLTMQYYLYFSSYKLMVYYDTRTGSVRVCLFTGRILFTNASYTTLDYNVRWVVLIGWHALTCSLLLCAFVALSTAMSTWNGGKVHKKVSNLFKIFLSKQNLTSNFIYIRVPCI